MLKNSEAVIQEPDGARRSVSPEQARNHNQAMDMGRGVMYEMAD